MRCSPTPCIPGPAAPDGGPARTFTNPVLSVDGVDHGDPFVLEFAGRYWLYHSAPYGIECYRSDDLVTWEHRGVVLAPQGSTWAQLEFWAPEVVVRDGLFVMYVAATVPGEGVPSAGKAWGAEGGDDSLRRQGVARSSSPEGPFVLDPEPLVDVWSIDGHPFVDDDGSTWLFYNVRDDRTRYVDGSTGCGNVVVRLDDRGMPVGEAAEAAFPSQRWEGDPSGERYWNEGAWVLKRRGEYHQMYSGGWFGGDDYGVGVAVAASPGGPWHKNRTGPVFVSGGRITGPGHHSVVVGPDGATPYAVYHGYDGEGFGRKANLDRLRWALDGPRIGDGAVLPGTPVETAQQAPAAAHLDLGVRPFHLRAWVEGERAVVAGVEVALDGVVRLLTASYDGELLVVRRDAAVVAVVRGADARPTLDCDGRVLSSRPTSRLEDERAHSLRRGQAREWAWGGSAPVAMELSWWGVVEVRLGDETVVLDSGDAVGTASLLAPDGAAAASVRCLSRRAEVSDVVLAARSQEAVERPRARLQAVAEIG